MKREKLYISTIDACAHNLAGAHGLGLEIAEFCTAWNLDREFPETDEKVRQKLPYARRRTLHGPYSELFPCAVDPKARELAEERYIQTLCRAQSYGVEKVIFHGGFQPFAYYPCWYQEQSVIFWKKFLGKIPENITVCLENVMEDTPELLADIVRQVGSPKLRMCLDVGHANVYSRRPPLDWVRECGDVIDHFHIHNNDGTKDTHSALFEGSIPMEELLETAERICPEATMTLELTDAEPSLNWLLENVLWEES